MDVYLCVIETKTVPKLETTMKMNEVLHIIQVIRCDHFILHPNFQDCFDKGQSTPPEERSHAGFEAQSRTEKIALKTVLRQPQ